MDASLWQAGSVLQGRYEILQELGQGGTGTTYAVEDLSQPGQTLAVKVLSLDDVDDWKVLELFEREAKVLSQLQHPGIPRYLDYFQTKTEQDVFFCIVQERIEGKSLAEWVEQGWHCDEATVRDIAEQVLEILIYLSQLDPPVIHRDIKPHNIIRCNDGKIFLVDFGAVRDTYYSTLMRGSTMVGTFGYMAPEQFQGHAFPTTDLYGLGATLLFLLTKRSPAELPHIGLKVAFQDWAQVSPQFTEWLENLLEPDVADRFTSAQDTLNVLRQPPAIEHKRPFLPLWILVLGSVLAILLALWAVNTQKWRILSVFGLRPPDICNPNNSKFNEYLSTGGNPNILVDKGLEDAYASIKVGKRNVLVEKALNPTLLPEGMSAEVQQEPLIACVHSSAAIKKILEHGANPNQDVGGLPLLHYAVATNRRYLAHQLLEYGADVNFPVYYERDQKQYQRSLLHVAVKTGDLELIKALVKKGVDINVKDEYDGSTPLDEADLKGEIARFLESQGAISGRGKMR